MWGAYLGRCEHTCAVPAVYHAIYLEELTAAELTEKLAQLFRVPAQHIQHIYKQGPTGIHVLVSDEVTPTCPVAHLGRWGGAPGGSPREMGSPGITWAGAGEGAEE